MPHPPNAIYTGDVFHERHIPFNHKLKYRVFSLFIDIDEMPTLDKNLKFFSYNRWNILSLYDKDHGKRDGSNIRPWIEEAAQIKNIDIKDGKIFMLAFPRLWGFVFNPLTIFFCYDHMGVLKGILYEVKNTFGEQHGYFLPVDHIKNHKIAHECEKVLHVSPFIQMDCTYKFRLKPPNEKLDIGIHQFTKDDKILTALWHGDRSAFSDKNIIKNIARHPLMTFKVIIGIHWEALKLLLKGAKYIKKPAPPKEEIT